MKSLLNGLATLGVLLAPVAGSAQAPKRELESDATAATGTCWFAYAVVAQADGRIDATEMTDAVWFPIESARLNRMKGPVLDQVPMLVQVRPADEERVRSNAADIRAQCMKRFPKSVRGATKIVLPPDRLARELLCTAVASFVQGLAREEVKTNGSSASLAIVDAINARGSAYMTDTELRRVGIVEQDDMIAVYGLAMTRAARMGNLNDVIAACR